MDKIPDFKALFSVDFLLRGLSSEIYGDISWQVIPDAQVFLTQRLLPATERRRSNSH